MKLIKLFIFLLCMVSNLIGQNSPKLDSLLKVLPTLKEDTNKVKTYIRICHQYNSVEPDKAIAFGKSALELSDKLNWTKGICMGNSVIADAYYSQGKFRSVLEYRLKEMEMWKRLGFKKQVYECQATLGILYSDLGDNIKALEFYFLSLESAEKMNNKATVASNLCNIGNIYQELGSNAKALEYLDKSLKISLDNNFKELIAASYNSIGTIYSSQKKSALALEYYTKAYETDLKYGRKQNLAGILSCIGGEYQLQSDSASKTGNISLMNKKNVMAIETFNKGLEITREIGNPYFESHILGNLGATYITMKKYNEAEQALRQSNVIAFTYSYTNFITDNYERLYDLYKKTDNFPKALECHEIYTRLKDSISIANNETELSEIQTKYETEKKEAENTSLTQQNKILELSVTNNKYLTVGLIFMLGLILSIAILMIRQNKLRSKQENVRLEQKLLRTQMNPHFIFNSLSGIESYIYEHQPKEAGNYLAQFARLMRLILENSASEFISLEKELETLNYYLSLQKLRLNDNLEYNIEVDPAIKTEQVFLPPMLMQPFIENSIEHGFRGIKECGIIKISFNLKENYLEIKITDNGIGIVQAQQQKDLYKEHKSRAMQITYERLNFLNRSKKQKLIFDIKEINGTDQKKGTEVIFSIPV